MYICFDIKRLHVDLDISVLENLFSNKHSTSKSYQMLSTTVFGKFTCFSSTNSFIHLLLHRIIISNYFVTLHSMKKYNLQLRRGGCQAKSKHRWGKNLKLNRHTRNFGRP